MTRGTSLRGCLFAGVLILSMMASGCDFLTSLFSGSRRNAEVEKAYLDYRAAMTAGDIQALRSLVVKQKAQELDAPGAEQMLAMARAMYPANATITSVTVQGETATLTAHAPVGGGTTEGLVHLMKEDGVWKVYDEKWEMKMSAAPPAQQIPDATRPFEYEKAVGIWKGHEAGGTGDDWTFTLQADYAFSSEGPAGRQYKGTAMADWNQGLEGGSLRVLRGGAVFDVRISESSVAGEAGQLSLGSFKRMGDTLQICLSEPGKMDRTSEFGSSGSIHCFELRKVQDLPAASRPAPEQPAQQPGQPSAGASSFRKQDPNVSGEAVVVKDGVTETYPLVTGFFSDTRFANPSHATIQFQAQAAEHSNARRIEITLDATRTGTHFADGKLLSESFMGEEKVKIGERGPQGYNASFRWVADGGQIFWPKTSCIITVTSGYTGSASDVFSGEVHDCPVHSAGIDHAISSVKFTMRGAPSR